MTKGKVPQQVSMASALAQCPTFCAQVPHFSTVGHYTSFTFVTIGRKHVEPLFIQI